MAGLQPRAEAGQADAPRIRQGHAEADMAQAQGREPEGAREGVLRATAVLRRGRRVPLRQRPVPVPVGADAFAAALCEEGRRRRQPDGGHHRAGDEPRQPGHGTHQRHPVPRAGERLPTVPAPRNAARGQRLHQQRHRRAADLPVLLVRPRCTVRCRRWSEIRRRAADRESAPLAQILWARQGRGRLHAAVQPRAAQRLPDRRARLRGPSRVRHLVSQHVGHRADRDHRRHAQRQQGQLRYPALVRPAFRAALHRPWRSVEGTLQCRRSGAVRSVPDPAGRENRPRSHSQREAEPRPDCRHARTEGDDAGHADPQAMHLHRAEPHAARGVRVRQAHPQHLHAALPARSATGAQRSPLTEPHRVLSPATLNHRPGRRQEGIDRAHRHRN